jgi:hypothetical protein
VNRFLWNDLLEIFLEKSILCHAQNANSYKNSTKSLAWKDVSVTDMKKFLAKIILMGHVKNVKLEINGAPIH